MRNAPAGFMPDHPPSAQAQAEAIIERIFAIGSTSRWLERSTPYFWHKYLSVRQVTCPPRISFWLRLLQSAGLLNSGPVPRPTRFFGDWLAQPLAAQLQDLLAAWVNLPARDRLRRRRQRLLDQFANGLTNPLSAWQRKEVNKLAALGLWDGASLTPLGRELLQDRRSLDQPGGPIQLWQIGIGSVSVPPQADRALLWRLEQFLLPYAPGRYLLNAPALRQAAQRGDLSELVAILEMGQERPLEADLSARILQQPLTYARSGWVLSFDQPQELLNLRQSPTLRGHLAEVLGPRHVFVPAPRLPHVLSALRRRGLPVIAPQPPEPGADPPEAACPLAIGELAELYTLALAAERTGLGVTASKETVQRLASLLPENLRRAAERSIRRLQPPTTPRPVYPAPEPPGAVPVERVERLQQAVARGEAVHAWYRASAAHSPERRRLSPLLVEQRGAYLYLVAYCHSRRANRTFRLDRMWLEEEADG